MFITFCVSAALFSSSKPAAADKVSTTMSASSQVEVLLETFGGLLRERLQPLERVLVGERQARPRPAGRKADASSASAPLATTAA